MVLLTFSRDDFLFLGLELVGFSTYTISRNGKDVNLRRFSDFFYASPDTIADLFRDIQDADLGEAQILKPDPTYLLLAMLYLKKYPTKHALAAFLDGNKKTGLTWAKRYVKSIQALKEKKVSHLIHLAWERSICFLTSSLLRLDQVDI
jgi:hypothetical protein